MDLLAAGYTPAELDGGGLAAVFGGRVRSLTETPADRGELTMIYLRCRRAARSNRLRPRPKTWATAGS